MFDDIDADDIQAVVNQVRQNQAARTAIEMREIECYGMPVEEMVELYQNVLKTQADLGLDLDSLVVSMLSDAQEQMLLKMGNEARQTLNRVKYLLIHRNQFQGA